MKWAGGKTRLLPQLKEIFPTEYNRYFEPFLGGGAVFFNLPKYDSYLNDFVPELVNAYQQIRDNPHEVMNEIDKHENTKVDLEYFKKIRKQIPDELDEITRAARTIYLNKTSFNGMYRVNQKGEFNIPMTSAKNPALYNRENILACSEKLQGVKLSHGDYQECLKKAKKGDFVYLDPPYLPISKTSSFTNYTGYTFEDKEHEELADTFAKLSDRGCLVVESNSHSPIIAELYKDFNLHEINVSRNIAAKKESRGNVKEYVITNF